MTELDDVFPLDREAAMSSTAIGIGLTQIRQYSFAHKGAFYGGLLSFTSGIERLAKLILFFDYKLNHNWGSPSKDYMKAYRHNLAGLIRETREIKTHQSVNLDDSFFDNDPLYRQLLSLLSDFASKARYYNLDSLTSKHRRTGEPLVRWEEEICTELIRRHYRPNPTRISRDQELANLLETQAGLSVHFTREDGDIISTASDYFAYSDHIETKQRYSMYYLYTIVRFLSKLFQELERKGRYYPSIILSESFALFRLDRRRDILRRRIWNPKS